MSHRIGALLLVAVGLLAPAQTVFAQDKIDFSRDVRSILAKKCFHCHGPGTVEAGLRLDQPESIIKELESGATAVVPQHPETSELIARITSDDEFMRMPPEGKPLSEAEIATLKQWIAEGAEWDQHWAFHPPTNPPVPVPQHSEWVKTPIDAFVLQRLEHKGLQPNPPADKLTLLRRVYFDLTGLPPRAEEIEQFLADESPEAFERVIDRLLDSPQYGEKWARHWLDLVRFAETNSFERDGLKPHAWRFRDYVIRSLNADKPYDQFIREQLAGDELENPTPDSIVATGYYRLGLWDDEPADRLLARYDGLDDIVSTTGQVFLGLTVNCARCHDHKIDPIPQSDYYSMVAFFQGLTPMTNDGPTITRVIFESPEKRAEYETAVAELNEKRNQTQTRLREIEDDFKLKIAELSLADVQQPDLTELESRFYRDTFEKLPNFDELKAETVTKLDPPYFDIRSATREDFFGFVFEGKLIVPADGEYTFELDSDDGSRLLVDGQEVLLYDGIHGIGTPVTKSISLTAGMVSIRLEHFQGQGGKGLSVKWSGPGFKQRYLSATTAEGTPILDLKNKPLPELIKSFGLTLLGEEGFSEYQRAKKRLAKLMEQQVHADYALCVTETSNVPETRILMRGSPHAPGDPVEPGFPTILTSHKPEIAAPPSGTESSGRRLALANWIASAENPMTARVIVNRLWQHHFGRGIVRSTNNFGLLGDSPTHPQLLDWLAQDFVAGGWQFKRLHKLILLSNVWQQSSAPNPAAFNIDPTNDLYWKFDPRRLSAEELRDAIHATTGELNLAMFGPGMYPTIPAEVLAGQSQPGKGWGNSAPEEQARRAIYIHVKRSLITPLLSDFDFCDTDSSCAARFSTVQPTQALGLLNGDFMQQRAAKFAERVRKEAGDGPEHAEAQIRRGLLVAVQREATEADVKRGVELMQSFRDEHQLSHERALELYCLLVLNLNEFLYLD